MRRLVSVLVLASMVLVPEAASAQERGGELAIGYTFRHLVANGEGGNVPMGFSFSAADRLGHLVSVVAEVTESHRSDSFGQVTASLNYFTFAGGVRFSRPERRRTPREGARPFVEVLAGASNLSIGISGFGSASGSTFHLEPKGGIDVPMGRSAALRMAVGYESEHGGGGWAHTVRLDIGAVFALGHGR
jgi:hypothetical protein